MKVFSQLMNLVLNGLGSIGLGLIIYGIFFQNNPEWKLNANVENVIEAIGVLGTFIGVILLCMTIYFKPVEFNAKVLSKYITAPLIIIISSIMIFLYIQNGFEVSVISLSGISILGLTGALFRIIRI